MKPDQREENAIIRKQKKEIQQRNRELARKDKALAEAAKLCGLSSHYNNLTLELTGQLAPSLYAGYRTTGQYLQAEDGVITIIVAPDTIIT